jgi:hypothetical protein
MAGQPKRRALVALLWTRAQRELGDAATPIDWVCEQVAKGLTMRQIADSLAPSLRGGVSRNFFSGVANGLTADARARIEAARSGTHTSFAGRQQLGVVNDEAPEGNRVSWCGRSPCCRKQSGMKTRWATALHLPNWSDSEADGTVRG